MTSNRSDLGLRIARAAAGTLLKEIGSPAPPIDPIEIAGRLGIVVEGSPKLGAAFSGCLLQQGSTFGILYSIAIPSDGFRRFTVAHELGHYRIEKHRTSLFASSQIHLSASDFSSDLGQEIEADHFAAELLMPEEVFRAEIRRHPIGREAIKNMAARFATSLTSTAIRYAQLTVDPVAVVVSEGDAVCYCFASPTLASIRGIFLRKGSPVPKGTTTARFNADPQNVLAAAEDDGLLYLSEWFDDPAKDFEISEDVIGLGRYGKTLTVLHASQIPDEDEGDQEDSEHFNPDGKRYAW